MCTRIYPDMVVAVNVLSAFQKLILWLNIDEDGLDGMEEFRSHLDKIIISADGCKERQEKLFINNGLSNVFVGYGDKTWETCDYRDFFDNRPDVFRQVDPQESIYQIDRGCLKNVKESIGETIKEFCRHLLTEGAYSPLLLQKYGLT